MIRAVPNQIIIIGDIQSVEDGIAKDLLNKIRHSFTIGTNYSFKTFHPTFLSFINPEFYTEFIDELEKIQLIVGSNCAEILFRNKIIKSNTLIMKSNCHNYVDNSSAISFESLPTEVFALYLAVCFLYKLYPDVESKIFLLGYDFDNVVKEGDKIKAIDKEKISNIKIYNVSYQNRIIDNIFEKIDYNKFFELLDKREFCQDCIRDYFKRFIDGFIFK